MTTRYQITFLKTITDEELMSRVVNGEVSSLSLLFEKHHKHVFNFLYGMSGDKMLSEDITQEVFFRLLKYKDSYNRGKFVSWLFSIARNTLSTHYRRTKEDFIRLEAVHFQLHDEEHEPPVKDKYDLLQQSLAKLDPAERELLILSKIQGLNHKEIAEITGSTIGAVRTRTCRALKKLKGIYFEKDIR